MSFFAIKHSVHFDEKKRSSQGNPDTFTRNLITGINPRDDVLLENAVKVPGVDNSNLGYVQKRLRAARFQPRVSAFKMKDSLRVVLFSQVSCLCRCRKEFVGPLPLWQDMPRLPEIQHDRMSEIANLRMHLLRTSGNIPTVSEIAWARTR